MRIIARSFVAVGLEHRGQKVHRHLERPRRGWALRLDREREGSFAGRLTHTLSKHEQALVSVSGAHRAAVLFVTAWSMTWEAEAIKPIKDWVAKNPGKICKGAEYIRLLKALRKVSPCCCPPAVHTRSPPHPTITATARADWILRQEDRSAAEEHLA